MTIRIPRAAGKTNISETYAGGKLIAISMRAKQAMAPQGASFFMVRRAPEKMNGRWSR